MGILFFPSFDSSWYLNLWFSTHANETGKRRKRYRSASSKQTVFLLLTPSCYRWNFLARNTGLEKPLITAVILKWSHQFKTLFPLSYCAMSFIMLMTVWKPRFTNHSFFREFDFIINFKIHNNLLLFFRVYFICMNCYTSINTDVLWCLHSRSQISAHFQDFTLQKLVYVCIQKHRIFLLVVMLWKK